MGSVPQFEGRRAPASTFQELNEKFFGAGFIQERTPCAGGACRQPSACACPAPPPATRLNLSWRQATCCAPGGGHWCGSFLWAAGCGPFAQTRTEGARQVFNSLEASNSCETSRSQLFEAPFACVCLECYRPLADYFAAQLARSRGSVISLPQGGVEAFLLPRQPAARSTGRHAVQIQLYSCTLRPGRTACD